MTAEGPRGGPVRGEEPWPRLDAKHRLAGDLVVRDVLAAGCPGDGRAVSASTQLAVSGKRFWQTVGVALAVSLDAIDVLAQGDREASAEELAALGELGYVVVPAVLPEDQVARLVAEFERLVADDPRSRMHEPGSRRAMADNDNEVFSVCWRHRVALDAAIHLLGERFQVGRADLRDASPGHGEQRYHPDHAETPVPGLTATWFLDTFTADNGATRLLPGSHRCHHTDGSLLGEVVAVGPAGSRLLRDARLYHRGGRNSTTGPRRSVHVFYQHHIDPPSTGA